MGIKHYQEKNARAMEKELAQSNIPVKRKIPKTIRNYHFPEIYFDLTACADRPKGPKSPKASHAGWTR